MLVYLRRSVVGTESDEVDAWVEALLVALGMPDGVLGNGWFRWVRVLPLRDRHDLSRGDGTDDNRMTVAISTWSMPPSASSKGSI